MQNVRVKAVFYKILLQKPVFAFKIRMIATTTSNIAGETMGPLTGLKVVDLTHVMAGPTCTLMLADMGAEVIKIEKIPAGDDTRYMVPPKIGDEAASFLMMNRNKKGIALDRKTPGGAKVLRRLIGAADVLVENFGPDVMDRLRLGLRPDPHG